MYEYRLTRLGKIALSVLIGIVFLTVLTIFKAVNASAKTGITVKSTSKDVFLKNLNPAAPNDGAEEFTYSVNVDNTENRPVLLGIDNNYKDTSEKMDSSDADIKNDTNETLMIPVEQAYSYSAGKIAFLTFDDGPSKNITPVILDILDRYKIKATFFVLGSLCKNNSEIIHEIVNRGHALGIHTYSHDYGWVYANKGNFVKEIRDTEDVLKGILGGKFKTRLFRFPGGSSLDKAESYKETLKDEGYVYIDWNSLTGDGEASNIAPEKLLKRLEDTSKGKQHLVVLMHDSSSKRTTVQALPGAIDYLKSQGYEFAVLK